MGIRQSLLDNLLTLAHWATWKEQLSFGGKKDSYEITFGLPQVQTRSADGVREFNDFLLFVTAHEFGHIIDFANQINRPLNKDCYADENVDCRMDPKSWAGFSWETFKKPKAEAQFPGREQLCFYWCTNQFVSQSTTPALYEGLYRSSFISIYASTQPWDDFADSLAYFVLANSLGGTYFVQTGQGQTYDMMAKLTHDVFLDKYRFLDRLLKRHDLIYP